jgi:hypothetical protein
MTDATTSALQNLLQSKHGNTTLPLSIANHIRGVCDAVAGRLTKSLSHSVAGQSTYNILKLTGVADDWSGSHNANDNQLTVGKPAIPIIKSFFLH